MFASLSTSALAQRASNAAAAAKQSVMNAANAKVAGVATMNTSLLYKRQSEKLTSLFFCNYNTINKGHFATTRTPVCDPVFRFNIEGHLPNHPTVATYNKSFIEYNANNKIIIKVMKKDNKLIGLLVLPKGSFIHVTLDGVVPFDWAGYRNVAKFAYFMKLESNEIISLYVEYMNENFKDCKFVLDPDFPAVVSSNQLDDPTEFINFDYTTALQKSLSKFISSTHVWGTSIAFVSEFGENELIFKVLGVYIPKRKFSITTLGNESYNYAQIDINYMQTTLKTVFEKYKIDVEKIKNTIKSALGEKRKTLQNEDEFKHLINGTLSNFINALRLIHSGTNYNSTTDLFSDSKLPIYPNIIIIPPTSKKGGQHYRKKPKNTRKCNNKRNKRRTSHK